MGGDEYKSSWKIKSSNTSTPWGDEIRWAGLHTVDAKCLRIKKGNRTSLKYYKMKNEVLFVYNGKIKVQHGDERTVSNASLYPYQESILKPGEAIVIQSFCPYRIEALEDSEVIELGDNSRDANPVRIEDDFGRKIEKED